MDARKRAESLEDEIVQLFAEVDVTTYLALEKVGELDATEGFAKIGFQSTAHWLNFRVGISMGAAREHVRVAGKLRELPQTSAAMRSGWLSYSKVRALTRIANAKNEERLLDMARTATATQIEKLVRKVKMVERGEAQMQGEARSLVMGFDEDGMFFIRGRLLADEGARVMAAIGSHKAQLQADAFMAAISAAQTTELVVHVDAEGTGCQVQSPQGERVGVSAETLKRAACDASVVVMTHGADGSVLDVGRKTRKIPLAIRRALSERDGGCRYPGCPNRRVDAHHVHHWADGGETKLSNLTSLCRFHHVQLHEGGYTIVEGVFFDRCGRAIDAAGAPACVPTRDPARAAAVPWTSVNWTWRQFDYGIAVSGLMPTLTAQPPR